MGGVLEKDDDGKKTIARNKQKKKNTRCDLRVWVCARGDQLTKKTAWCVARVRMDKKKKKMGVPRQHLPGQWRARAESTPGKHARIASEDGVGGG